MSDSRLKLSQLRAFVTVAQHGSFSTAALELGLSQSTMSHAIASLEAELDVVLLNRGRHGASLTHDGEQILPDAQQILALLDSIRKKANLAKGLESGQVRLASVRSVATHLLPEAIAQFREKFPNVGLALSEFDHYAEVEQALRNGQHDIGFVLLPAAAEFEVWELCRDEFVVLLPPTAPLEPTPLTWEQLARYPLIMTPVANPHIHARLIRNHLEQFGQSLPVTYEVKEDSTVISMVRRGLGASIMARLAAEPIPPEIQIRSLPVPLERTIAIAVLSDALLSRAAIAFLDVLRAVGGAKTLTPERGQGHPTR